ncbi:MAG TPA: hypothetical protein VLS27_06145 [Gammaproteobacteria bacterium]|nr:hypothetical protein [Gammaproteobacteria bacterium]
MKGEQAIAAAHSLSDLRLGVRATGGLPRRGQSLNGGHLVTGGTRTDVQASQIGDTIRPDFGLPGSVELEPS